MDRLLGLKTTTEARLFDLKTTAEVLGGITTRYVYMLLEAGELQSVKIGKRRLVTVASIDDYVARLAEQSPAPSHRVAARSL